MLGKIWLTLAFAVLLVSTGTAKPNEYDGLKLLGSGKALVDQLSDSTLVLHGFAGKYDEKLAGVYLTQHGKQVRFYMGPVAWDTLKQKLTLARDQWETISPTAFAEAGDVKGYRVGDTQSTMVVSIQGATKLDKKRLNFSLNGGGNTPQRVFASISFDQVKLLVEQLHKVDEFLRASGPATP